ncbi:MAG: MBL fold metallo-hydrolase [Rubrivivax sp.]|nr:MAG: MBL fold metallo-hydrolase [Rubrivivax sp.]
MKLNHPRLWAWVAAPLATLILNACNSDDDDPQTPVVPPVQRAAGVVVAAPVLSASDAAGNQTINIKVLTAAGLKTIASPAVSSGNAAKISATLVPGNLVDWESDTAADTAKVAGADPAKTFQVILSKGTAGLTQFNLAKYGWSVNRLGDTPGAMVAAGWIYAKTGTSITVGDGGMVLADQAGRAFDKPVKRYEETYTLASDVKVYNVNTADYAQSAESTLAALPVTADYSYATTSRQAAYLLFDQNYLNADKAKVVAIWYFTPQARSDGKPVWDVPTQSPLLADKGTDPVSGLAYVSINATTPTNAAYSRSTEPFEMVKGTMYYVGDNEVASYILKADMGTPNDPSDDKVIKIDAGWPNSGYQYWKNMELLGIDPRSVTDLWLTHGHADHYGTVVEQLRMMDNAGKTMKLWASREDAQAITADLQGNTWNIPGALPLSETEIRARTSDFYQYDKWYDFGNVQIMVIWSPGHTPGSTNMVFKVKNPTDGKFYTFGYHGGYGFNGMEQPTASNGWKRLAWQAGFSYLQQSQDIDFVSPQHTNHFPIVEVFQALKAYNRDPANAAAPLTMFDAMRSRVYDAPQINGASITTEFSNQLEKRRSVVSYRATDSSGAGRKSLETSGPFKPGRENGLTVQVTALDDGKIIQGFVGPQNKNPRIPLLANGIPTTLDAYVNDPTGYYVQVTLDVLENTYKGYLPDGYVQLSPGLGTTLTYQGGPVESVIATKGTLHPPEYLRTQRLASLEDAQKVLASIRKGGTFTVTLTPASEIAVPVDVTQTFR